MPYYFFFSAKNEFKTILRKRTGPHMELFWYLPTSMLILITQSEAFSFSKARKTTGLRQG